MRIMPFMKRKRGIQFAGVGIDSGGGGDTSALANKTDLTAIILTGTTNTSGDVISAGTWFYLNGTPCVAKVGIAPGATFTEGTNYEEKTVGSVLSELNSNTMNRTIGVISTSDQNILIGRQLVMQTGRRVNCYFCLTSGILSSHESSLTLSGVTLPSIQIDFPIGSAGCYGRGYLSTNGDIVIVANSQSNSEPVSVNFGYDVGL